MDECWVLWCGLHVSCMHAAAHTHSLQARTTEIAWQVNVWEMKGILMPVPTHTTNHYEARCGLNYQRNQETRGPVSLSRDSHALWRGVCVLCGVLLWVWASSPPCAWCLSMCGCGSECATLSGFVMRSEM